MTAKPKLLTQSEVAAIRKDGYADTRETLSLCDTIDTLRAKLDVAKAELEEAITFDEPVSNPYAANAATVAAVKRVIAQLKEPQ